MEFSSAIPRPDFVEVQLRILSSSVRPLFIEWLTDALSTELSRHSSIVDGVDDEESETCISMHGTNAAQMVLVARRVLSECERPVAVQIVETQQSHGAEFAA